MQSELGLMRTLQTPFDAVYELSQDRTQYVNPPSLRGTPIAKITEDSPYWIQGWASLDAFLTREGEEEALKQHYRIRHNMYPDNKDFRDRAKRHQDNMSKYHKIREIFGPHSDYHPNQLVSKRHIPVEGLCHIELMYRLACKISDLRVLQARGTLAMDPWDFIRWRIDRKIQERMPLPGQSATSFIRTIIYKLCDEYHPGSNPHGDPVMREAAILAAKYQNRLGNYKTLQQRASSTSGNLIAARARTVGAGRQAPRPARPAPRTNPNAAQAAEEARRERRAKLAAQPSRYQGVNAFRAQMQARGAKRERDD